MRVVDQQSQYATGAAYARAAREAAVRLGKANGVVTINDVRSEVGDPPAHVHPTVMGQVFRGKDWNKIDEVASERANRRKIAVFEYVGQP